MGKVVVYLFASWVANASKTALLMSIESSPGKRVMWLEPDGLPDILFGNGGKVSVEEVGKGGGEFISVVKFNTTGAMSEY